MVITQILEVIELILTMKTHKNTFSKFIKANIKKMQCPKFYSNVSVYTTHIEETLHNIDTDGLAAKL